jgi:hypothetical protein
MKIMQLRLRTTIWMYSMAKPDMKQFKHFYLKLHWFKYYKQNANIKIILSLCSFKSFWAYLQYIV